MGRLIEGADAQGIPDAFGVPSYYVHRFFAEEASPTDVRLYACAKINGVIVPQYLSVMPAQAVLEGSALVRKIALRLMGMIGEAH